MTGDPTPGLALLLGYGEQRQFRDDPGLTRDQRSDPQKLRELVPEPLQVDEPLAKFEFIRMPDCTGFGDYTKSGQVVRVSFEGRKGGYSHCMFLDDHPPIAGAAIGGAFPRNSPTRSSEPRSIRWSANSTTARFASPSGRWANKHKQADLAAIGASLAAPNYLLKIIPHVDRSPRISELVEYHLTEVELKGAWTGPAQLSLMSHALAPVAELPALEVVSAVHIIADLSRSVSARSSMTIWPTIVRNGK